MTKTEKILLAGAIGAGVWLWTKARALGNLVFNPGNIQGFSFVGGSPVLRVSVLIQNTSSTQVRINSFAGNVWASASGQSQLVGNIYAFQPVVIPGNSMASALLDIRFNPVGIVNDIITSFQNGNFARDISVQGFANVGFMQIPINLKFGVGQ